MCGKEFEAPASDIGRVFCGRACSRRSFMGTPPWMRKARG
jgi:hypothetical protein